MKRPRKDGGQFSIRLKEASISTKIPDPIFEDPIKEQDWPTYDPSAYERFEKPPIQPFKSSNAQTEPYPGQASKIAPGVPPKMFEEWDGPLEYDEELRPWAQTNGRSGSREGDVLRSIYRGAELPCFGPQYGILTLSHRSAEDFPVQSPTVMRSEVSNPYEDMMRNADADLERTYLESLKSSKGHETQANPINACPPPPTTPQPPPKSPKVGPEETAPSVEPFGPSKTGPTSCIICAEDFSTIVRPPGWTSLACLHEPSVCCDCLARCIRSDLENKIWNQIKCPECKTLLIYEDIKRLADPQTFSRYEVMSFRSAVGAEKNFVWCMGCDFGQLHESGASQPIIRCMNCGFRSCFVHSIPWHERLTCEEYDQMLQDPDGFQSAIDKEDEAYDAARRLQDEGDERLARKLSELDKQAEHDRQEKRHAEEKRRARAEQKAEAARKKSEEERAKKREELKRRQMEEQWSMAKVQSTTKQCPGCQWPIEKNEGCDHMTCIQCRHEFCWRCMKPWRTHSYGTRCH